MDGKILWEVAKAYAEEVARGLEDDSWNEILWLDDHGFIDESKVREYYENLQGRV